MCFSLCVEEREKKRESGRKNEKKQVVSLLSHFFHLVRPKRHTVAFAKSKSDKFIQKINGIGEERRLFAAAHAYHRAGAQRDGGEDGEGLLEHSLQMARPPGGSRRAVRAGAASKNARGR